MEIILSSYEDCYLELNQSKIDNSHESLIIEKNFLELSENNVRVNKD